MKRILAIILFLLYLAANASAQFYTVGDDPAMIRWSRIESRNFNIIYPSGLDSLASVYVHNLEKYRIPVSGSAGYAPCGLTKAKMPVVLHAFNAMSNGSVAWAPKRMDLFTSPQAYGTEPMPWTDMLAIHESRHVAQMQFGMSYVFKPFTWIFGEMWTGAMAGLYPGGWLLEGDAVIAETALTSSGRGRTADFLNYYMRAFDRGDMRNWNRWNYGSYKYHTPDEYALGYMVISGIRHDYDEPHFTGKYLKHAAKRPYDVLIRRSVAKEITGHGFEEAATGSMLTHHRIWKEEKEARKPFISSATISDSRIKSYTEYRGNAVVGSDLWAVKSAMQANRRLVKIDSTGRERRIRAFAAQTGRLRYSSGQDRIYWSETVPDIRWSQKKNSLIRYYDLGSHKTGSLTRSGRIFHPYICGDRITATEYLDDGRSRLVIIDTDTGGISASHHVPDSLQLIETAVSGDAIYGTAISGSGYGIYRIKCTGTGTREMQAYGRWENILAPLPVRITGLDTAGSDLLFASDRTGVSELYRFSPGSGTIIRITSTEYGGDDFVYGQDGKTLYFSAMRYEGAVPEKAAADSLLSVTVNFPDIHAYRIADSLSAQELRIAEERKYITEEVPEGTDAGLSKPERYRKFPHLFNIHSWAPVYFSYDNISSFTYDRYYDLASLGATAMIQNRLGTFTGQAGYSAHKDPYDRSAWRHSGHLEFTYSGLYPVIEASVDINDRASHSYRISEYGYMGHSYGKAVAYSRTDMPYIKGKISVYIPFNFSSGGWYRGLVPRLSYSIGNDIYDTGTFLYELQPDIGGTVMGQHFSGYTSGKRIPSQTLGGSLRAYSILVTAQSEIYPDWGIGAEIGASGYPGISGLFPPAGYAYIYGYIPGITPQQGLKLTAMGQISLSAGAMYPASIVNTLPRGLSKNGTLGSEAAKYGNSFLFTADYAIPIYAGDFSIGSVFYGKRVILTPHFDYMVSGNGGGLYSAGLSAALEFGCFFWIGTPITLGITYSYNGGPSFSRMKNAGIPIDRHYIGPVFSISLPQ